MSIMNTMCVSSYQSPCGTLLLGSLGDQLCLCDWSVGQPRKVVAGRLQKYLHVRYEECLTPVLTCAIAQLDEYFAGQRRCFDIPLLLSGTDFQQAVWHALLQIPYGETVSYLVIAERLGCPSAVRAVAHAIGANALSVFIPCHRVIGKDGTLTGYAGGLPAKTYLLTLEGCVLH